MAESKDTSTGDLFLMAQNARNTTSELSDLTRELPPISFCSYLNQLMEQSDFSSADFERGALISRAFSYQIRSGIRTPSRNIVLRLAIVMHLELDQAQRLLTLSNRGILYPRLPRDAVLINCLANRNTVYQTNEILLKLGLEPIL